MYCVWEAKTKQLNNNYNLVINYLVRIEKFLIEQFFFQQRALLVEQHRKKKIITEHES